MITKLALILAAVCAGIASTMQGAANAGLSARAGLGVALVVNTTVVLVCTIIFFFATGRGLLSFPPASSGRFISEACAGSLLFW